MHESSNIMGIEKEFNVRIQANWFELDKVI